MKRIARIWKETFAIAKAKKPEKDAFANVNDKTEMTVIIDQKKLSKKNTIKAEKDYKLVTFDMLLPFSMTGFIAKIATALAKKKIPIFVVSAYSTDHLLIKKKYLKKTEKTLESLGFVIKK